MIQKGIFRVCFSIILREKSEQDTLESKTLLTHHPPLPLPNMSKNSFVLVGLPFPIFKRPGVFICCRTVSLHQAGDLTCWIAIFQIWGGKWLKCRQCSLFSDKGLATTVLRNNVCGGRRASLADTCCCWYKVAVILSVSSQCHLPCNSATSSDWTPYTNWKSTPL